MAATRSTRLTAGIGGKISRRLVGSSATGRETEPLTESAPAAISTHSFAHYWGHAVSVDSEIMHRHTQLARTGYVPERTFASVAHRRIIDWRAGILGRNRGRLERKLRLNSLVGGFFDVEQRRHFVEMAANLGCEFAIESLDLRDLVDGRFANPLETAEMTQQRAPTHRTDAFDIVEHRAQPRATPQFAVVGDRKSMRLVANPHEQEQRGRVLRQHDRILAPGNEDAFLGFRHFFFAPVVQHVLFGQRHAIDLIEQSELAQHFERDVQLSLAAVDHPQIRVDVFAHCTLEPALQDFVHAGEVILSFEAANPVAAVEILARLAFVEGDLRSDHHRALQIRNVVAFHPLGRVAQTELDAKILEHLLAGLLVIAPRSKTLARIVHRHFEQAELLAALRHYYFAFLSAPL